MNRNFISREISIPYVLKVQKGVIKEVGRILKDCGFESIIIFYGEGIYNLFGKAIEKSIREKRIEIVAQNEGNSNKIEDIYELAFKVPQSDVIIGIGGGKVIDISKYVGYIRKIPVITFPTAPSNDSICSPLCSVYIEGKRTTVPAKLPFGVISDTEILASAPEKFIYSGIGDMISKVSSIFDLDFEEREKNIKHDDFARMVSEKSVFSLIPHIERNFRDEVFLQALMDSLIMSGIAMEIEGDSAPASGSEHLISHALDKILPNPHLHGIQVGIATYICVNIQENPNKKIAIDFLEKTGFFRYVEKEVFNVNAWMLAIDTAPSIKPHRYTTIHLSQKREEMKNFIQKDSEMKKIFKL